ncbi:MAG: transcriptional regulator [Flavobacterium sp.]|uniref:RrF2 family transcriptional regulator n=1 Tax=unclassified Flavobacterium TaxID=196869 RepID=UPI000C62326D|nr:MULTISPECIES: Rrf2 family transcriptional regulator [unclassified Flavobacterium]MBF02118.1 transcriptional regulator [Flavobacterium sp.]MCO6164254.1 Rrf2 family transcriptional regulator [Flavobacterium sp. NRK F7]VXB48721.1 putative HTH-type transcriptional regulator rrf2-like [Flavobacterium sp. 9AF]|tara:strand:+ start:452 stop:865 length:414 start_codon:yes stop_codon:yes gene_type:complete
MLSRKTKYGIKALIYIAKQDDLMPVLISEISEKENISKKFLEAILLDLKKIGLVGSKKGKGGGYYLLKNPKEITVATIIRFLDGPIALLPCVSLNFYEKCDDCPSEETCSLNKLMIQVRDNALNVLEKKTLYDLANF